MILPGKTIGILGGGQLGRMLAQAAERLGYRVHVYEPSQNSPAGEVSAVEINAPYTDVARLKEFVSACDVVTYEFENIPVEPLWQIEKLAHDATGAAAEQLASLGNKLKELPLVALNGQAATLYGDIDSADGAPSPAQRAAVAKLTQDYPKALERWNELVKELKAANITVTTKPVHRDDDDDSDDDIG